MLEEYVCQLKTLKSVEEWVKTEDEENCPPCLIPPLASYYLGVLEEAGKDKLAEELKQVYEEGDLLTIAKKMDIIKSKVGENLRANLEKLDCMAQSFKETQNAEL